MCSCGENRFAQRRRGLEGGGAGGGLSMKDLRPSKIKYFTMFSGLPTAMGKQQKAEGVWKKLYFLEL